MRAIDIERIKKHGLNPADFKPKPKLKVEDNTVIDAIGNEYRQEIGTDGRIYLILMKSYTGELFE